MASTRYSESRTLVRRLRRLAGESREDFKGKVLRLRRQFEQFNVDASEVCQWVMSLRPGGKKGCDATKEFWQFFLEPERFLDGEDKDEADRYRRMAFDVAAELQGESTIADVGLSESLVGSIRAARELPLTPTATRLFGRLAALETAHRQVLLKAAAEWIVARYVRGYQNWQRQREEWAKEKADWEKGHPELTASVRDDFNAIFKDLNIKIKRPHVCTWERLKANRDDCEWAGERIPVAGSRQNHSSLCVKYRTFLESHAREARAGKNFKEYFVENAKDYVELRRSRRCSKTVAMERILRKHPQARWFPGAWEPYLRALEINEQTVLDAGRELPHCVAFGPDKECQYNKHTNECQAYRRALEGRPDLQAREGLYREWRREYLSAPAKPCFQYPSPRRLPMPKIFGKDYFRADLVNSLLELRLEGSREGQFERFRFASWPASYEPKSQDAEITSVHINFVGTRARAGFHFRVQHKKSRFAVSQDEIDELRSQKYPRGKQDAEFLAEARKRLEKSFDGDAQCELRILAVDLGTAGGSAALFEARCFKKAEPLKIVKIEKLYDARPKPDKRRTEKPSPQERKKAQERGLGTQHVGRHLASWASGAREIAERRGQGAAPGRAEMGEHDMRRLVLHMGAMIRDWVRLNASQIIKTAEQHGVDLIVMESMRGFQAPGYDKVDDEKKRRLAFFAHGRIRHKVREKAVERGMRVVTVPYLGSSQICAKCGKKQEDIETWKRNKREHRFGCGDEKCGHESNSDENAARVLARVFWGEINLPEKLEERT